MREAAIKLIMVFHFVCFEAIYQFLWGSNIYKVKRNTINSGL